MTAWPAPAPPSPTRCLRASSRRRGSLAVDASGVDGGEDDELRCERVRRGFGGVERRVAAEVGDPPAAGPERQAEGDQPELVPLAREAREQCERAEAAAPAACEAEQPPAEDARREVLLRDRGVAARPALAEIVEVGEHDVGQERVECGDGQRVVEDGLRARLVEAVERVGELLAAAAGASACRSLRAARLDASAAASAAARPPARCCCMRRTRSRSSSE